MSTIITQRCPKCLTIWTTNTECPKCKMKRAEQEIKRLEKYYANIQHTTNITDDSDVRG